MTRPGIIRADTIDLQDQKAPSAQDHSRQPTHPSALGAGPAAPHQAETLREVAAEAEEEQARSPRVSGDWQHGESAGFSTGNSTQAGNASQQQAPLAGTQNGYHNGSANEDSDTGDMEGDDDLDDDMMDKISSSPSIDDGRYSLPIARSWPARVHSRTLATTPTMHYSLGRGSSERSSSPFMDEPVHFPLPMSQPVDPEYKLTGMDHHLQNEGRYEGPDDSIIDELGEMLDQLHHFIPTSPKPAILDNDDSFYPEDHESVDTEELLLDVHDEGVGIFEYHDYDEDLMMVPYETSDEDEDDAMPFPTDSRFIDSGWGGECLQDIEDIDFEFVYALHTFVATVEGQANATKGDTMVLLDDSNSYWWLVRVVKDSSIGYLPAEHIETPTERLARLNKHRNIDLSAAMLGDQNDKPKNPLKKAMRRRNAKTVAFAAPTYVEASDIDYSSDEEDEEAQYFAQQQKQLDSQNSNAEEDDAATVKPLSVKSQKSTAADDKSEATLVGSETSRDSDEIFEGRTERHTKNGTVRNTDSFFKDDTVETRKISLTPNILRETPANSGRDDSSTSTRASNESAKEIRQRSSLDKLDKEAAAEKGKDEKKKKEKKSGMLSGLFKRKDKKSKAQEEEDIDPAELIYGKKTSEDSGLSLVTSKESEEFAKQDEPAAQAGDKSPQRSASKLTKPQPVDHSQVKAVVSETNTTELQQISAPSRVPPSVSTTDPSLRLVQPDAQPSSEPSRQMDATAPEPTQDPVVQQPHHEESRTGGLISKLRARSNSEAKEPKPEKVKKAKARMEMDDFDSSTDVSPVNELVEDPMDQQNSKGLQRPIPGAFPDSFQSAGPPPPEDRSQGRERLSESPVHVSPVNNTRSDNPPALMVDTSSQEEPPSPVSSPSPELINAEEAREPKAFDRSFSASTSTPTWSDAHLRTFFDDDADIKDLLVVVYDKSGVVPAGPDHPVTGNLFREENAKLAEITTRLDGMLGEWLARKQKASAAR